jgi:hypothetical protein
VKTDRPYYYPGNTVFGKIYIRADVPMDPSSIEIFIKGKVEASFIETTGSGKNRSRRQRNYDKKIIHFKGTCFIFKEPLNPGDYTIPFEFTLPASIPASIIFDRKDHHDHPFAKVKYTAQAIMVMKNKSILKYKQWLVVHEPPVQFIENSQSTQEVALTTCCCCG